MADITMCGGGECPLKETCYRYKAEPNEYRQAYFLGEPFVKTEDYLTCDYFWDYEEDSRK
jgi:hypothetical protein